MSEFFLASLEFHPIFVGVKVKGGTKKNNSYKFSSKWRSPLYWKEKGRLRTSFRRDSSIPHVKDQMS